MDNYKNEETPVYEYDGDNAKPRRRHGNNASGVSPPRKKLNIDLNQIYKELLDDEKSKSGGGELVRPSSTATPSCSSYDSSLQTEEFIDLETGDREHQYSADIPGDKIENLTDVENTINDMLVSPLNFKSGKNLVEEELLLYTLLHKRFISTPFKAWSGEKYDNINSAIRKVYGFAYKNVSVRNYFYKASNNLIKGLGKERGRLLWKFYHNIIRSVLEKHDSTLANLLTSDNEITPAKLFELKQTLSEECVRAKSFYDNTVLGITVQYEENLNLRHIESTGFLKQFSLWQYAYESEKSAGHLYMLKESKAYPGVEIILNNDNSCNLIIEGQQRECNLQCSEIPQQVMNFGHLKFLLRSIESMRTCSGFSFAPHADVVTLREKDIVYRSITGEPGAYKETLISAFHKDIIRSAKCSLLLPGDDVIDTPELCDSCNHSENYLRVVRSKSKKRTNDCDEPDPKSKFARLDQLSYEELLSVARNSAKKLKVLNQRIKRLQSYRAKMNIVGNETDKDLRAMFSDLHEGIKIRRRKAENCICKWDKCEKSRFENCEVLYSHAKSHIDSQGDIAPVDKEYICGWKGCTKKFAKKKLVERHLRDHTGDISDTFFEILLKDQAKALTIEARQMCWHPVVIKWSLRTYNKSHSMYEDMRSSKMLKLPSGRTLSDYRNFDYPKSGWHSKHLQNMLNRFKSAKISNCGKLGMLVFDEVKIKEGLVFDPSTWELIGFTDLGSDKDIENLDSFF